MFESQENYCKMNRVLLIISLAIVLTSCSNDKKNWDIEKIETVAFEPIDKFGEISGGEVLDIGHEDDANTNINYDEYGKILFIDFLDKDLNMYEKCVFEYNEFDSIKEKKQYNQKGELIFKWVNTYNSKKKISQSIKFNTDGEPLEKIEFNYLPNGNLKKQKHIHQMDSESKFWMVDEFKYNEDGMIIEIIGSSSVLSDGTEKFAYDDLNRVIKREYYDKDKKLNNVRKIKYDEQGNLVEEKIIRYNNKGKETTTDIWVSKYSYDKENNWITKVVYLNSNPTYFFERKIKYFGDTEPIQKQTTKDRNVKSGSGNQSQSESQGDEYDEGTEEEYNESEYQANNSSIDCADANARFNNSSKSEIEDILGIADKEYRNDYWFFLIYYNKVTDKFDGNKTKHLCFKVPTMFNHSTQSPIIQCIESGGIFHMGASYLRLP